MDRISPHFSHPRFNFQVSYIEHVMPLLRRMGATGILIEYEDMFPYRGSIANISATNCYSARDIGRILDAAKTNGLSVIPLIQTFGHLESVLKLEEFANLREVRESKLSNHTCGYM